MLQTRKHHRQRHSPGFGLIDSILSIAVVGFIAIMVSGLGLIVTSNSRALQRLQATVIADEQLNALKRIPLDTLTDQTNGPFLGVLPNAGSWRIGQDANDLDPVASPCPPQSSGKHCGANVLSLAGGSSFVNTLSGRLAFPADVYTDTTVQASWRVSNTSPSNWVIGMYLRARDPRNGYRLRIGSGTVDFGAAAGIQNLILEKLTNGVATTLGTPSAVTITTNTWFSLAVVLNGNAITLKKDGANIAGGTITDATAPYLSGKVALAGWNGVIAAIDDVTEVDGSTCNTAPEKCWSFEAEDEIPTAWTRFGANDLPDLTPNVFDDNVTVTLEPWPVGATDMKKATVTVSWSDGRGNRTYQASGYLRKNNIGL